MSYTKQQLIDAYCRAKFFEPTPEKTKEQFITEELDKEKEAVAYAAAQFGSAQQRIKRVAIKQLQEEVFDEANIIDLG